MLEALRLRSSLKALLPATLQHAATAIAIVAIDTDGLITYINRPGMELVQEFTGQARLRKNLIGQNLAKVLNRGLPLTIIGRLEYYGITAPSSAVLNMPSRPANRSTRKICGFLKPLPATWQIDSDITPPTGLTIYPTIMHSF